MSVTRSCKARASALSVADHASSLRAFCPADFQPQLNQPPYRLRSRWRPHQAPAAPRDVVEYPVTTAFSFYREIG
jgi:hypothetical protein